MTSYHRFLWVEEKCLDRQAERERERDKEEKY